MNRYEFLQDTIDYYSVNPKERRSKSSVNLAQTCFYSPKNANKPNSQGCAIGRHLSEDLQFEFDAYSSTSVEYSKIFNQLPEEMQLLGGQFLRDVQSLHDSDEYWNEEGLSEIGQEQVRFIKKRIETEFYLTPSLNLKTTL